MKKFLLLLPVLILIIFTGAKTYTAENPIPIKFIYINGANNNTPQMQEWFFNGIKKVHPDMKNAFESSSFIRKKLLHNGQLYIENEPGTFFWGDKTLNDLETLNEGLITLKMMSPKIAQMVRSFFAHCMHDAIWVQKDRNMQTIVKELHKTITESHKKGEKVILFGYSAGSFITFEYLIYKLPAIEPDMILNSKTLPEEYKKIIKQHPANNTCIDALITSELAVYSTSGKLIPNLNPYVFEKNYLNLDNVTKNVCTQEGSVLGVVNFASPLVLFYSDIKDPTIEINQYNGDVFKYMKDNNMFQITVNFADDPLGYPLSKNLSGTEIENLHDIEFKDDGRGFFHDKSDIKSPATFLGAHTSYWRFSKKFAKAVADAYKEGYINFYSEYETP